MTKLFGYYCMTQEHANNLSKVYDRLAEESLGMDEFTPVSEDTEARMAEIDLILVKWSNGIETQYFRP